jgi:hypothetical protein
MTTTDEPRSRSAPEDAPGLPRARPYLDLPGPLRTPRFTPRRRPAPEPARPALKPGPPAVDQPKVDQHGAQQPPSSPARQDRRHLRRPAVRRAPGVRAVIGDEIRIPIMWCEFGSCITRYTHPGALGEGDLRARALAAGWRYDALGRLACPDCVQHDSTFWPTRPPALVTGHWYRAG